MFFLEKLSHDWHKCQISRRYNRLKDDKSIAYIYEDGLKSSYDDIISTVDDIFD